MVDNAFDYIEDFEKAQKMSDSFDAGKLLKKLTWLSGIYCPVHKEFGETYHWSIMQQEYATDIVFKSKEDLKPLYDGLIATAMHSVKPANIATFRVKANRFSKGIRVCSRRINTTRYIDQLVW